LYKYNYIKIKLFTVYSKMFCCSCCNYETNIKANYQKHNNSNKHKWNIEKEHGTGNPIYNNLLTENAQKNEPEVSRS